jgi:hypothetical protein
VRHFGWEEGGDYMLEGVVGILSIGSEGGMEDVRRMLGWECNEQHLAWNVDESRKQIEESRREV